MDLGSARSLTKAVRRIVSPKFGWAFAALAGGSLLISLLDVAGILLLVPLVDVLSSSEPNKTASIPLIGDVTAEQLLALMVGFFIAKSIGSVIIRWFASGVVNAASAQT